MCMDCACDLKVHASNRSYRHVYEAILSHQTHMFPRTSCSASAEEVLEEFLSNRIERKWRSNTLCTATVGTW